MMKLVITLMSILYVANALPMETETAEAVATAQTVSLEELEKQEFNAWKKTHSKSYANDMEEIFRMKIFKENKLKVDQHNLAALGGSRSYRLKMNQYGDMLSHEVTNRMKGFQSYNVTNRQLGATYHHPATLVDLPDEVDWRTKGVVSEVKDQGQCGSCWAFSATGAMESQHALLTGELVSLSEQNLMDCSQQFLGRGCAGGVVEIAFDYARNNGIATEQSYPYTAAVQQCPYRDDFMDLGTFGLGFTQIQPGNEMALKHAIATMGPVSVGIDANPMSFNFYADGVYDEPECTQTNLDHAVLAVGYGTDEVTGQDYWLVKNSWGTSWGEDGYIKMARNRNNMCGIATHASYPVVN